MLIKESDMASGSAGCSEGPALNAKFTADTPQQDWQAQPQSVALVVTSVTARETPGLVGSAALSIVAASMHCAAMARLLAFKSGSKPQQPRHQTVSSPLKPKKVRAMKPRERGTG
jgi:hypothetical protein